MAAPSSAFSPFKQNHSLMPELPQGTISRIQNPTSPKRATASLPAIVSPASKSQLSFIPESPEKSIPFGVQNPVSPRTSVIIPQSSLSASVEKDYSLKPAASSLYNHPESPTMSAIAPSKFQKATDMFSMHMPNLLSKNERQPPRTPEKSRSPYHETLKRKHVTTEEELPSSSPIGPISPKRRRPSGSELPVEIASTPEKSRAQNIEPPSSPLFIKLELEEDEPSLLASSIENSSPLGQQLSDTLSEPGYRFNNTQGVFENATPLIDFDVPEPEGGWDNEELLGQNSSQPISFGPPPPGDSREDSNRGIRGSTQLIDFDLAPPEGGWDEQELRIKEESESSNTEIYDPQPILPDTQAILQSKIPALDFSIPDPDGGWNNLIASSPPIIPSSPRAESVFSQTELKDQMDAWIDAHAIKGISVEQVESVLKSTSMDTTLADKALRHLAEKGVLPKNRRGVWTESDDEDLKSTDARRIQRLQEKHGADCLTARWEFLDFYAEVE